MTGKGAWKKYQRLIKDFNNPWNTEEYYINLLEDLHRFNKSLQQPLQKLDPKSFDYWSIYKLTILIDFEIKKLEDMGYGN